MRYLPLLPTTVVNPHKSRRLKACFAPVASLLTGVLLAFGSAASASAQTFTWSTLAGTAGSSGADNGQGAAARFNQPNRVAVDSNGNVYVADTGNHVIRRITAAGAVTTFAGKVGETGSADGQGANARFNSPKGIAIGGGFIYVADRGNFTIRKITLDGSVSTFAGTAGIPGDYDGGAANNGTGPLAKFTTPEDLAVDKGGNVYVSDTDSATIRKISPAGVVSTFAGIAGQGGTVDGPATSAKFSAPRGLTVDKDGNVYVADDSDSVIRKITAAGAVTTLAGNASASTGTTDGTGSEARFKWPFGVTVDAAGNLYVADSGNHTIRKITPNGVVTTVAGTAGTTGSSDAVPTFNEPFGITIDSLGNLYVTDFKNHTIRKGTAPVDRTRPTLSVTTPKGKSVTTKAKTFTLRGKAGDNLTPTRAEFRIKAPNKRAYGSWKRVNLAGTAKSKNWSYKVALSLKGKWLVEVRSVDAAGNRSAVRRITITRN